jgi:hypothetical protein
METEHHLPIFKLIDACEEGGCPICTSLRKDEKGYFESLLYEHVNNRYFRAKFNRSGGFCGYHADYLAEMNDALAVVLLYRQILRETIDRHTDQSAGGCPACEYLRDKEAHLKAVLWKHIGETKLTDALQRSGGLCIPHYYQLQSEHLQLPAWFAEYHERRFEDLLSQADAYVDACNFTLEGSLGDPEIRDAHVDHTLLETLYGFIGLAPHHTVRKTNRQARRSGGVKRLAGLLAGILGKTKS